MKGKVFLCILLLLTAINVLAVEPGNNLGKTIQQLQNEFPHLKYSKSEPKGDLYIDNSDEGLPTFFWFRNGRAIEECLMVQDSNDFPLMWWRQMCDKFYKDKSYRNVIPKPCYYQFFYSTFKIDLIYIEENQVNTAMIVYTQY